MILRHCVCPCVITGGERPDDGESAARRNIADMAGEPLLETLNALRDRVPAELRPVLDAFSEESEDAPEEAWRRLLKETLDES